MTIEPSTIDCAVIYAGDAVLLAIPEREGRFPIKFVNTEPLYWICHDGVIESLRMEGLVGQRDLIRIRGELEKEGLLVAEMSDITSPDLDDVSHYLLKTGSAPHLTERARE